MIGEHVDCFTFALYGTLNNDRTHAGTNYIRLDALPSRLYRCYGMGCIRMTLDVSGRTNYVEHDKPSGYEGKALRPAIEAAKRNVHWRNVYAGGFVGIPCDSRMKAQSVAERAIDAWPVCRIKVIPKVNNGS